MDGAELLEAAAAHVAAGEETAAREALDSLDTGKDPALEHGRGLLWAELGDFHHARASFEIAVDNGEGDAVLDYAYHLGRTLTALGELAEARRVLRENVDGRRARFGKDSVEHALSLDALAEAQLAASAFDVALDAIAEAIDVFFLRQHARYAGAVALEAEIVAARGGELRPYMELGELPDVVVEEIATASIARCRVTSAERALIMLEGLRRLLLERLGESHGATIRVLAGIANTHREMGQQKERRTALDALAASFECLGAVPEVVETLLARALAEVEDGLLDSAQSTHEEARRRAVEANDARMESKVLRFTGFLALDRGRVTDANAAFEEALKIASDASDASAEARAQAALGLGQWQAGDSSGAKKQLEAALIVLPPHDPDVEWVTQLVQAIERGEAIPEPLRSQLEDAHLRIREAG